MPGMAVQGINLKTDQGNIEVYLGPPEYVTKQKFILQKGDTLEVKGLMVLHGDKAAFLAAKVKKNKQTLSVLDKNGSPLFLKQENSEKAGPGGKSPGPGGGMMGGGGMGKAR